MVSVEILEEDPISIKVLLKEIEGSYANAIRRFAISEVPCMAIDDVVILENSSVVYDELVAHRLGLMPLRTDLQRYRLREVCDCNSALGCNKCSVLLVLDSEAVDKVKTVYSGDLVSEDPFIRPISDAIPLVELAPDQKIKLEAYAKLGRGKEHAKWQPSTVSVLKETGKRDEFLLEIESVGSLAAREIFLKAVELLNEKLTSFAGVAGGLK